jgi:hypothetical protein
MPTHLIIVTDLMLWVSGVLHAGLPADATPLNAIVIIMIIIMVIAVTPVFIFSIFFDPEFRFLMFLLHFLSYLSQKINAPYIYHPIPTIRYSG